MRPFLLLTTRADDGLVQREYDAFLRFGGLAPDQLRPVRLDRAPMPDLDLDDLSGVLLGGSPFTTSHPVSSKSPTQLRVEGELSALLDVLVDRDFPFFGACYGVGTLGTHEGAVVDGTYGEPVGVVTVELTEHGRHDPLFAAMPPRFEAFVGHQEAIRTLPDSAVALATSPACPVQAFRVRQNLYATQFHPELDAAGLIERIHVYRDSGYFPPETMDEVVASVVDAATDLPPRLLAGFVRRYAR